MTAIGTTAVIVPRDGEKTTTTVEGVEISRLWHMAWKVQRAAELVQREAELVNRDPVKTCVRSDVYDGYKEEEKVLRGKR